MTIDKEQLISLLEDKTGLEREQVEGQLSQLIDRIRKAAEEGKDFEIEGFGTFSMTEEGLQFAPADKLETEINNKYAGMKPIELIGAFKEPETDEEIPEIDVDESSTDSDDKWALDTDAMSNSDESEDEESFAPQKPQPVLDETKSNEGEEPQPVDSSDDLEDGAEEETVLEELDQESAKEKVDSAGERVDEESDDLLGTILVAAVVVLAVGVGGWLTYDLGFSNQVVATNSTTTEQSTSDDKRADTGLSSESEETGENISEPEQQTQVPNGGETEQSSEPEQEQYGLLGEANDGISNGYTIVVHSLRDRQTAEQNRQRLQEDGYRALINHAKIQGVTYYRVGIGQFETVDDAQEALSDIPKRFRGNNFIKRIQ
ncbi:SPOR domain-containing protein [Fodinibius sp. Rm-B-1B1-1]|uniref:HU family DNA-binding protein n=1 Tax=Fodinibius alkaliphilus TaxID=3140241 RepID=UPI00315B2645